MIDIHSHILFDVDDGPKTKEQSIAMLKAAAKEGIKHLISTSHSGHPMYDVSAETVLQQVKELQEELDERQIPITLHVGHEVRISENIVEKFKNEQIHTLAGSEYLLLELPSNSVPYYTKELIRECLIAGLTPVIAHPERNRAIADKPSRLERLIREGAVAQLTAGSIAGHFGRKVQKLSLDLVRANLVHTYGSDAHNLKTRPFLFNKGLAYLEKKKELDAVDLLLENNDRILRNERLIVYDPEEVKNRKWRLLPI